MENIMQQEVGLTQNIETRIELLKKTPKEYLNFEYSGLISHKKLHLNEYKYVDFQLGAKYDLPDDCFSIDGAEISLTNIIFSAKEKVQFYRNNFSNIKFINCVFVSHIMYTDLPSNCNITFDSCIILNSTAFNNKTIENLLFQSCVIKKLIITASQINGFEICDNEILEINICDINSNSIIFQDNNIYQIAIEDIHSSSINFSVHEFYYLKNNISIYNIKRTVKYYNEKNKIYNRAILSTLEFLEKDQALKSNPISLAKIDYLKIRRLKNGILDKIAMLLFGHFLFPGRIVLSGLIIIVIFALLLYYTTNASNFKNGIVLFCLDDIIQYFNLSLDSFLGSKTESKNIVIIIMNYIERIFGFLIPTAFTIALAKKYVK
jgi:hypothetical protein